MNGKELIRINDKLKADRSLWDQQWQDIADNIVFRKTSIIGVTTPGDKKTTKMYDSTATTYAQKLAAWINGNLTSGEWFSLKMVYRRNGYRRQFCFTGCCHARTLEVG